MIRHLKRHNHLKGRKKHVVCSLSCLSAGNLGLFLLYEQPQLLSPPSNLIPSPGIRNTPSNYRLAFKVYNLEIFEPSLEQKPGKDHSILNIRVYVMQFQQWWANENRWSLIGCLKHTALIPSLSGVSLRTVSFSSTAIKSDCGKSFESHKDYIKKFTRNY